MDGAIGLYGQLLLATVVTFAWLSVAIILWWFAATYYFFRSRAGSRSHDNALQQDVQNVWLSAISLLTTAASLIVAFSGAVIGAALRNSTLLITLAVTGTLSVAFMGVQPEIISVYLSIRQCVIVPMLEGVVYPLLNILRMVYDMGVGGLYWYGRVSSFLRTGWSRVLLQCGAELALRDMIAQLALLLSTISIDVNAYLGANPTIARFTIKPTMFQIGEVGEASLELWECFCSFLFFLVEDVVKILQSIEFQCAVDHILNVLIRTVQIIFNSLFVLKLPTITLVVEELCPALTLSGDTVELALQLVLNSVFGLLTVFDELPEEVNQVLDVPWSHIVTEPACGIAIVANMTLEASLHILDVFEPNGTGIEYFRYRPVIDRLYIATSALGGLFIFISPRIPALLTNSLHWLVNVIYFILEFGPGIFFYVLFPFKFDVILIFKRIFEFMVLFWDRPLDIQPILLGRDNLNAALGALGDLGMDINQPLGTVLEHSLRLIVAVAIAFYELAFYFGDLLNFQPAPHKILNDIELQPVFLEMYAICNSVANVFRQFDGDVKNPDGEGTAWCVDDAADTRFWCCAGNVIESICRLITVLIQEVTLFMQSLMSWFADDNIVFHDLTFDEALQETKLTLCGIACVMTGLIPADLPLNCTFVDPDDGPTCTTGPGCLTDLLCSSFKLILIPLEIGNDLFNKLKSGGSFASIVDFFSSVVTRVVIQLAQLFADGGGILDCFICVIGGGGSPTPCSYPIYTILKALGDAIVTLVGIFNDIFFGAVNLVITFFTALFVDGNLVGAFGGLISGIIDLLLGNIFGFLVDSLREVGAPGLADFLEGVIEGIGAAVDCVGALAECIFTFGTSGACDNPCPAKRSLADHVILTTKRNGGAITVDEVLERNNPNLELTWADSNACKTRMETLGPLQYHELGALHKAEVAYCLAQLRFHADRDRLHERHYHIPNECDTIMDHYIAKETRWATLRFSEQIHVAECMRAIEFMDWVHDATEVDWLPNDMLANPYRKYIYGAELFGDARISWQYYSDRTQTPAVVRSPAYQKRWRDRGMWTEHYDNMYTDGDVNLILATTTYEQYFYANRGRHLEASRAIIKGLDSLLDIVGITLDQASEYYEPENDILVPLTSGARYRQQFIVSKSHTLMHDFYALVRHDVNMTVGTAENRRRTLHEAVTFGSNAVNTIGVVFTRLRGAASDYLSAWSADRRMGIRVLEQQATPEEEAAYRAAHARDIGFNVWFFNQFHIYPPPVTQEEIRHSRRGPSLVQEWDKAVKTFWRIYGGTPQSRHRWGRVRFMYNALLDVSALYMHDAGLDDLHERERLDADLRTQHVYQVRGRHDGILYTRSQIPLDEEPRYRIFDNWSNVIRVASASGVPWLYDNCFYVDQLVGWIIETTAKAIRRYTEPHYLDQIAIANEAFEYFADHDAPARIGNTAALPLRFPHPDYSPLDYIGINSTLIRFSDLINATAAPSRRGTVANSPPEGSLGAMFVSNMQPFIQPLFDVVDDFIAIFTNPAEVNGENNLFVSLFHLLITCDYDEELFGTAKRFAPVEVLLLFAAASGITGFSVVITAPITMMYTLLFVSQSILTLVFASLYLTLTQSYSYQCLTTLPFDLWRDLAHSIFYVLYARCSFLFSGLIKDDSYDLSTCRECRTTRDAPVFSCMNDAGFTDIISNFGFIIAFHLPEMAEDLKSVPLLGDRISYFQSVDYSNPNTYSLYLTCSYTISFVPNLAIGTFGGVLAGIFTPAILTLFLVVGAILVFIYSYFKMVITMARGLYSATELERYPEFRDLRNGGTFGLGFGGGGGGGSGGGGSGGSGSPAPISFLYQNRRTGAIRPRKMI